MPSYDVCIPFHPKDKDILEYCIPSIRQNLPDAQTIFVVSAENPDVEGCVWIPETSYPFTKEDIGKIILCPHRVGWYLQQLLKLYCHRILPSTAEYILILDSDVIIKKKINFFHDSKILFAISEEDTPPYFTHMEKLIPGLQKQIPFSGIVHHIMTKRNHMETLLSQIEEIHNKPAWKGMLELVDPEDYDKSGMADYEIYFNYCIKFFPTEYEIRPLRFANVSNFSEFQQEDVSLVALHAWMRQ